MNVEITNIFDLIDLNGESLMREKLSTFSCPFNLEIESFIRERAIEFAKRSLSITYLVTDSADYQILGYFALTHKSILVNNTGLSKTAQKKLARYSRLDTKTGNYMASAFLLAQFGKNYSVDEGNRIKGSELMQLALNILMTIRRQIGGGLVYLDCEDNAKLITFYENEGFKKFGERFSEDDGQKYIQFMRFL